MELRWSELPNTILRIGIPAEIVRVKIPGLILVYRAHAVRHKTPKVRKFSSQYVCYTTNIFRQALHD